MGVLELGYKFRQAACSVDGHVSCVRKHIPECVSVWVSGMFASSVLYPWFRLPFLHIFVSHVKINLGFLAISIDFYQNYCDSLPIYLGF